MGEYKGLIFAVGAIAYSLWVFRAKWLAEEIKRNALHEAPSEDQLRWHIRHIRQDLHALVLINQGLLLVVAWFAVFRA